MRWQEQQAASQSAADPRPASPQIPALRGDLSSPARKQKTNSILAENTWLLNSPPDTPSRLIQALEASNSQIIQYRSRTALQGGRI
jgi:hypothetical protein